jgi:hypothetical protein
MSSLSNSFTVQSNALDVDKHMLGFPHFIFLFLAKNRSLIDSSSSLSCCINRLAYIETEMKKKKGLQESTQKEGNLDPFAQLYQIPDHLQVRLCLSPHNPEMVINGLDGYYTVGS